MAHGVNEGLAGEGSRMIPNKQQQQQQHNLQPQQNLRKSVGVMGSRRIFAPAFKLRVLDSYRNDIDCRGNQRATARKYGIHRRQIQKWLQCEDSLRSCCAESSQQQQQQQQKQQPQQSPKELPVEQQPNDNGAPASPALNLSLARLHGDELAAQQQQQPPPPPQNAQTQQPTTSYRFHAGYPESLPFHQHFPDYSMLYHQPPPTTTTYQRRSNDQQQLSYEVAASNNFQQQFESKLESPLSSLSPASSTSPSLHSEDEEQQRRSMPLLAPTEIKTERASPVTPPSIISSSSSSNSSSNHQLLKREENEEEEEEYHRASSGSSSAGSPIPRHLDCSLPNSPRESSGSSSESELEQQAGPAELARRRSFSLRFKLDVLDAFHRDPKVAGNQRATARKFGINRRQVQKWLGQENELRGVIELCGSRQRLGPLLESNSVDESSTRLPPPPPPPVPVDLRTQSGQLSPRYGCCDYYGPASPPQQNNYVVDPASLTPPYSASGCPLSCCQEQPQPRYCFSPTENTNSLKRSLSCSQSCCYTGAKKICLEEKQQQPVQETPLCLVKPKMAVSPTHHQVERVSSTVPSPPAPSNKKDAILFKPYLDNPVSKPSSNSGSLSPGLNNNCQDICNLNERPSLQQADLALELSFKLPMSWRAQQHQQYQYMDFPHVRSAFVRYPTSAHYS